MNIIEAQELATKLMQQHQVNDYRLEFDGAKRRFGYCSWQSKVISLSRHLVQLNDEATVRSTILHEIAHALTPKQHHNQIWKAKAIEIGHSGARCYGSSVATPPKKWIASCPNGHEVLRHKKQRLSCSRCCPRFNKAYLFRFRLNTAGKREL